MLLRSQVTFVALYFVILLENGLAIDSPQLLSTPVVTVPQESYRIVSTTSGLVRGIGLRTLLQERLYFAFKGIPYAESPVKDKRFKPPVPIKPWNETLDAFEFGAKCLQLNKEENIIGSEDCLFLNIYVPDLIDKTNKELLPVMFYLHGGGFSKGSGNDDLFGPDFLVEENVILVTINYRLGAFGFLSLGTPEYSGNAGLKDQQLALKWINENIEHFDGDKKQITLCGHSAGAASVNAHLLSSTSRGLFQRGILMGASILSGGVYNTKGENLLDTFYFARQNGNFFNNYNDLVDYIISVDASLFIKDKRYTVWRLVSEVKGTENPILSKSLFEYMEESMPDIDIIIGYTNAESILFMADVVKNLNLLTYLNENFYFPLQDIEEGTENYQNALQEIRNYYFEENGIISNETIVELLEMYSDYMTYLIDIVAKHYARKSSGKVYYYRLSAETTINLHKINSNLPSIVAATHGDELCYFFRCMEEPTLYAQAKKGSTELMLIEGITKMITNFMKYGNPTPKQEPFNFQPIQGEHINFVDISNYGFSMSTNPNGRAMNWWSEFSEKFEEHKLNYKIRDEL